MTNRDLIKLIRRASIELSAQMDWAHSKFDVDQNWPEDVIAYRTDREDSIECMREMIRVLRDAQASGDYDGQ